MQPQSRVAKFREDLKELRQRAMLGGGQKRIDSQHKKGKLSARERLSILIDEGSFLEYDQLLEHRCTEFGMEKDKYPGDSVITGQVQTATHPPMCWWSLEPMCGDPWGCYNNG